MAKKQEEKVTMRVRIGDNELEVTGSSNFVENKISEFLTQQKAVPSGSTRKGSAPQVPQDSMKGGKAQSMAQFLRKLAVKTDVDRALAAGYFLEKYKDVEKFTAAELTDTIHTAKTQPPKNTSLAVHQNIKKGYMMAAGDKDGKMAFVLTTDGEEAIEVLINA